MSYLDRIRACNSYNPALYRTFRIEGELFGKIRHEFAGQLARFPTVFRVSAEAIALAEVLDQIHTPEHVRTAAAAEVFATLRDEGVIEGWRDELHPVSRSWTDAPKMLAERAAISPLGVGGYAVHMNGYVRGEGGLRLWVGKRSPTKSTEPGKLDHLVAGGQPAGLSLHENLIKECKEEAGISAELAAQAVPAGFVSYAMDAPRGFRPDVLYVYDLELPSRFIPQNTDGEVDEFFLWPVERVMEVIRDSDAFKLNCALVVIDFLARHGCINPEEPEYVDIVQGLRVAQSWRCG